VRRSCFKAAVYRIYKQVKQVLLVVLLSRDLFACFETAFKVRVLKLF
jgi:hypothetical protein